ncbi:hypothetical protein [Bacillus sp. S14(2024)]|uniref:hypothetical protein n=1 Tax=Bacillus sp. S14(2024) TaxID=3162884 RepID=UPI003D217082
MKGNLKNSTIIVAIFTIIACEIAFALYDHSFSLDTIYFTIFLICIFLLFGTRISKNQEKGSPQKRKRIAVIFWPCIVLLIVIFIIVSLLKTGHVSMKSLIAFTCMVLYVGFVIIGIVSRKNNMKN